MEVSIIGAFFIAFAATFVGGIPFGAINLSVVNITINKSFGKAMQFALAASLIELIQVCLAIFFGTQIHFMGPGCSGLFVHLPVHFRNVIRVQYAVLVVVGNGDPEPVPTAVCP